MVHGLYSKKDTYFVIGGIVLLHVLVIGLCMFWCYRFLWNSYDASVFILLILFLGGLILCDVLLSKVQGLSRFLVRCKVDHTGLHCSMPFKKNWSITWEDIHTYGLMGINNPVSYVQCFFSVDRSMPDVNQLVNLSDKQIVFQVNTPLCVAVMQYLPKDIKTNLLKAQKEGKDRAFRR